MKVRGISGGAAARNVPSGLVPGQLVRGRVVAQAGDGRFIVTIRGYLLQAASDLPLEPGQRLLARVEVDSNRLLLRVQEEQEGHYPAAADLEDPEEIERVLELLGHRPSSMDILEFQERLDRYRPYASLPGLEPSDTWILAILWTRGIRSGADSFALISYYLRAQVSAESQNLPHFPEFDQILPFLQAEFVVDRATADGASENDISLIPGIEDRRAEAILLLNRDEATAGSYGEIAGAEDLGCALFRDSAEAEARLIRLADHPISPSFVIELAVRKNSPDLSAEILIHSELFPQAEIGDEQGTWQELSRSAGFNLKETNRLETGDGELIRGAFWGKWRGFPHYDRRA